MKTKKGVHSVVDLWFQEAVQALPQRVAVACGAT